MTDFHGGRRVAPDARDANFPMRLMLDPLRAQFFPRGLPTGTRHYQNGPVLDQGPTGTCVAHAWAGWSQGAPLMIKPTPEMQPFPLYDRIVQVDEWSDNDHDTERQFGTSVRAGAKILAQEGHIKQYLWAESVEDIRSWHLAGFGTVVLGLTWYERMMATDKDGFARVGGGVVGGHAFKTTGWSDERNAARCRNSWGRGWGQNGQFWLSRADLEVLLADYGEACAAVEQKIA